MPKVTSSNTAKRRRSAAITLQRLTEVAFAIVESEGAAGLSARKLAQQLGCEAMSLYHHVPNMDAILDRVVGHLLAQCTPPVVNTAHWRRQLQTAADDYLAMAARHPRVFAVAAGRRWVSPSAYALAAALVALFQAGGLTAPRAARAARALGAYLNGAGMALAGWKLSGVGGAQSLDQSAEARTLRQQFSPDSVHADLNAGLHVLIDGLLRADTALDIPQPRPASTSKSAPATTGTKGGRSADAKPAPRTGKR